MWWERGVALKEDVKVDEMAHWLRVPVALAGAQSLVPDTHVTTTSHSISPGSKVLFSVLFWAPQALHLCKQTHARTQKQR